MVPMEIAIPARGNDVLLGIDAPIPASYQVLSSTLKLPSLGMTNAIPRGKLKCVVRPHRRLTLIAAAALADERERAETKKSFGHERLL